MLTSARPAAGLGNMHDPYLDSCLSSLLACLSDILPAITHSISDELARIGAAKKPVQPGADLKPLKAPLSLLPVILHVVASPCSRPSFSASMLTTISGFLSGWDAVPFQGSAEFRRILMLLIEAISQHQQIIVPNHEVPCLPSRLPRPRRNSRQASHTLARAERLSAPGGHLWIHPGPHPRGAWPRRWWRWLCAALPMPKVSPVCLAKLRPQSASPPPRARTAPLSYALVHTMPFDTHATPSGVVAFHERSCSLMPLTRLFIRALGDVLPMVFSDKAIYDPSAQASSGGGKAQHAAACTKLVHEQLVRNLLPKYTAPPSRRGHCSTCR